ncbi:MAG: hypothetical protein ACYDC9_08200 [Dermatophilaceae bacterium]
MTTTATTIKCPEWCTTRHDRDPDGGHDGPSWPDIMSASNDDSVSIGTGDWDDLGVVVYLEAQSVHLTPAQAREAGLALLSAASWAKDHQAPA